MTYRQILLALPLGASHTFPDIEQARSARAAACKLYLSRAFRCDGATITRTA